MKPLCKTVLSSILVMLLTAGCFYNVSVHHEYDAQTDFDRLETYNWFPLLQRAQVSEDHRLGVKRTVDEELETKGLMLSETDPDFLVSLHFDRRRVEEIQEWEFTEPMERDLDLESRRVKIRRDEVTIYLYFIDAESRELFWHGSAMVNIFPHYSHKSIARAFDQAALEILRNFPPAIK